MKKTPPPQISNTLKIKNMANSHKKEIYNLRKKISDEVERTNGQWPAGSYTKYDDAILLLAKAARSLDEI